MSPRQLQARDLLIKLDRSSVGYVGRQLENELRTAIRAGTLPAGALLPSTRALAEDLGVSRGVVVRAYSQLCVEGYVDLRQGANPRVRCVPHIGSLPEAAKPKAEPSSGPKGPKVRFDLRPHLSDVGAFPRQAWVRSLRDSLAKATNAEMGYIDERGLGQLRVELAAYLGRARGVVIDPEQIVITNGAAHALSLISLALYRSGSTLMAVENPSHWWFRAIIAQAGQTIVPVPVDSGGLRVDMLGNAQAVVVAPAHQFPTGVVLAPERRHGLIAWARSHGSLIIEDDYDAEFQYDRPRIGALQGDGPDVVAYVGSTAKTLAPAVRLGWAALPPDLAPLVANELAMSSVQVSGIDQLALADFFQRGDFDRHVRRMRTIYQRRRDLAVDELTSRLPELDVSGDSSGLHLVLTLPSADVECAVVRCARAAGVVVQCLSDHAIPGQDTPTGLLVGFGTVPEPTLPEALTALASAVRTSLSAAA